MSNTRLLELINRSLAGEATGEELEEMKSMLSSDGDAAERYNLLQRYWEQDDKANQVFAEEAFLKIANKLNLTIEAPVVRMNEPEKRRAGKIKTLQRSAIAALIVIVTGLIFFVNAGDKKNKLKELQAGLVEKENASGIKRTFVLADGTKIWLNAGSKIQFPRVFTGNSREVYLNGEAFFNVAKNPLQPFIIHLANGTIRVLGTSFNVRAFDDEKIVETSVATGKVAFIPRYQKTSKNHDTVFLSPNNKVRYLLTREEVIVEPTVSEEDRSWIAGKLIFKGMTFEEIGVELERNFAKKLVFVSDTARKFRLTGSFQNNSLEEILFYLSKSKEFDYKITNDEVLISIDSN